MTRRRLTNTNPFGLHDMHGNVQELCQDGFDAGAYANRGNGVTVDPRWLVGAQDRSVRGGSYSANYAASGSSFRTHVGASHRYGDTGFRVVVAVGLPPSDR